MSLRRIAAPSPAILRTAVAVRFGSSSHADHSHHDHHASDHHEEHGHDSHGHGHGHGSHGHGHGHHHHEQKLLTKLPLGPKYPGGKNWGLFVGVNDDPTKLGLICVCLMSTYIFFVYYYHTGF